MCAMFCSDTPFPYSCCLSASLLSNRSSLPSSHSPLLSISLVISRSTPSRSLSPSLSLSLCPSSLPLLTPPPVRPLSRAPTPRSSSSLLAPHKKELSHPTLHVTASRPVLFSFPFFLHPLLFALPVLPPFLLRCIPWTLPSVAIPYSFPRHPPDLKSVPLRPRDSLCGIPSPPFGGWPSDAPSNSNSLSTDGLFPSACFVLSTPHPPFPLSSFPFTLPPLPSTLLPSPPPFLLALFYCPACPVLNLHFGPMLYSYPLELDCHSSHCPCILSLAFYLDIPSSPRPLRLLCRVLPTAPAPLAHSPNERGALLLLSQT